MVKAEETRQNLEKLTTEFRNRTSNGPVSVKEIFNGIRNGKKTTLSNQCRVSKLHTQYTFIGAGLLKIVEDNQANAKYPNVVWNGGNGEIGPETDKYLEYYNTLPQSKGLKKEENEIIEISKPIGLDVEGLLTREEYLKRMGRELRNTNLTQKAITELFKARKNNPQPLYRFYDIDIEDDSKNFVKADARYWFYKDKKLDSRMRREVMESCGYMIKINEKYHWGKVPTAETGVELCREANYLTYVDRERKNQQEKLIAQALIAEEVASVKVEVPPVVETAAVAPVTKEESKPLPGTFVFEQVDVKDMTDSQKLTYMCEEMVKMCEEMEKMKEFNVELSKNFLAFTTLFQKVVREE